MEICNKCGNTIKESKWKIKKFKGKPYCSKCHEKVTDEFYNSD